MVAGIITTMTEDAPSSMTSGIAQLRLWQLISPALPVGAYAYSGALEAAMEQGDICDAPTAQRWIEGVFTHGFGYIDLPLYARLYSAWQHARFAEVAELNRWLQAMRESRELLAEDRHMGTALQQLLGSLEIANHDLIQQPSFATAYALACHHWLVPMRDGALGLAWSWLENQVTVAVKMIPLGQTDGQKMLGELMPVMQQVVERALQLPDDAVGQSLPGLALLSAAHEHQYSRMFRS